MIQFFNDAAKVSFDQLTAQAAERGTLREFLGCVARVGQNYDGPPPVTLHADAYPGCIGFTFPTQTGVVAGVVAMARDGSWSANT